MSAQVEIQRRRWVRGVIGTAAADEIEGVIFAGFGGVETGGEAVTGRPVKFAINHDPYAISQHALNHPDTYHFCCDVREVDPRRVYPESAIGWLHGSPDCTHFSNAKGGQPVEKGIRALANVMVTWAKVRRPRIITVENVKEFLTWGPLEKVQKFNKKKKVMEWIWRPDKKKSGQYFKRWKRALERLGYKVEHNLLKAADFGAPTIRTRLFIVARLDGEAIVWPTPTHAPADRALLMGLEPYHSAAECIDFSRPGRSIFNRKTKKGKDDSLEPSTMQRLAKGVVNQVLRAKRGPFIVGQGGPIYAGKPVASDVPLGTITTENHRAIAQPFLSLLNHSGDGDRAQEVTEPMRTLTSAHDAHGLTSAFLEQMSAAFLSGVGGRAGQSPERSPADPARTITSKGDDALAAAFITSYHAAKDGEGRDTRPSEPLPTQDTSNRHGSAAAFLQGCGGREEQRPPRSLEEPARTVTQVEGEALAAANLVRFKSGGAGREIDDPAATITQIEADGLQVSYLEYMKGTATGVDARGPMPTVQAQGNHIAEVRLFLKEFYDDYDKLTDLEKLGILTIDGQLYQITDITLRMLAPDELLRAQFGPYAEGFKLEGTNRQKVAVIGNSVCPQVIEALIRANYKPRMLAEAA